MSIWYESFGGGAVFIYMVWVLVWWCSLYYVVWVLGGGTVDIHIMAACVVAPIYNSTHTHGDRCVEKSDLVRRYFEVVVPGSVLQERSGMWFDT